MASMNKVMLLGHFGRDPETRYGTSGNAITNATIATTRTWKTKEGEKQEETEWHRLVFFGKQAEVVAQYCKKGDLFLVENGYLKTRKWTDKEGVEKYTTEIVVNDFQLMGNKSRGDSDAPAPKAAPKAEKAASKPQATDELLDDDIPF